MKSNIIKQPLHYNSNGEETMVKMVREFGIEATINFFELSAFKYGDRAKFKHNETQDLQKRKECKRIAYKLCDIKEDVAQRVNQFGPTYNEECVKAVKFWRENL